MRLRSYRPEEILHSEEFSIRLVDEVTSEKVEVKIECGMLYDPHRIRYWLYICELSSERYGSNRELVFDNEIAPDADLPIVHRGHIGYVLKGKEDMAKVKKLVDKWIMRWKSGMLVLRDGKRYIKHPRDDGRYRAYESYGFWGPGTK